MAAVEHWNERFSEGGDQGVRRPHPERHPQLEHALAHFGSVKGRTVVDLGCGRGEASIFFARLGARVLAVDTSGVAIENLERWCADRPKLDVTGHVLSAMDLDQLGPQDLVYGSLILHHLEPFEEFARVLRRTVRPGGKAFFYENNAASRTLVWFRRNVVGRLWIPKHGDEDEFPLTPDEVDELRRHFTVEQDFPELLYFELASAYLTSNRLKGPSRRLDQALHRYEPIRRRSYRQELKLS
jgi:2-polyprenyl-3-methyl-5-hydroxy-6-metoxy-1,4-benzoquinol methylase